MKNLMLANSDYRTHTTNEGNELQLGLALAGFQLVGAGFPEGLTHVPTILKRHAPETVLVHDKRDWDKHNAGCFNPAVHFEQIEALAERNDIFKLAVVKDAGSCVEYHQRFCEEIKANAVVTYYHDDSILKLAPFLKNYTRIRTYHSVDTVGALSDITLMPYRKKVVVSGALSPVYPLRRQVVARRGEFECDVIPHPGYSNRKTHTPDYLRLIAGYRVHVATASVYGFALRKIIESVAVGTTPVTNLPEYDVLPGIDKALVRIPPNGAVRETIEAVERANREWDFEERLRYAEIAQELYDWQRMGNRLAELIQEAKRKCLNGQ